VGISNTHGSITIGKKSKFIITKPIPSYYQLPYAFGSNLIDTVFLEGKYHIKKEELLFFFYKFILIKTKLVLETI
jgi:imidazolonepropionase-like amidohydrolase